MSSIELLQPLLDGGIRSVNFFNGRLLSGEDLRDEQAANREAQERLGRAAGEGVAYGLEVAESLGVSMIQAPVVSITPGLAINRGGQTLALPTRVDVVLVRPPDSTAGSLNGAVFERCLPLQGGTYASDSGVYLLTIGPASAPSPNRAPVSGLGNVTTGCNTRYTLEGVQFRLVKLTVDTSDPDRLRNRLAYLCFGAADLTGFAADPFGVPARQYGLLDPLRPNQLSDCEVPLAVLHWTTSGGIRFIDLWAVRRRLTRSTATARWPLPVDGQRTGDAEWRWAPLLDDRRLSEAEAMFLQFQDQVQQIRANEAGAMPTMAATARFAYLPPVGMLPIAADPPARGGFNPPTFFGALGSRDVAMLDGNALRSLLHEARYHEPIDLSSPAKIQLYMIWENVQAASGLPDRQLALVFAGHTLPYRGVARFAHANWGLSRVAPVII
jgi:hypothetical protein